MNRFKSKKVRLDLYNKVYKNKSAREIVDLLRESSLKLALASNNFEKENTHDNYDDLCIALANHKVTTEVLIDNLIMSETNVSKYTLQKLEQMELEIDLEINDIEVVDHKQVHAEIESKHNKKEQSLFCEWWNKFFV